MELEIIFISLFTVCLLTGWPGDLSTDKNFPGPIVYGFADHFKLQMAKAKNQIRCPIPAFLTSASDTPLFWQQDNSFPFTATAGNTLMP